MAFLFGFVVDASVILGCFSRKRPVRLGVTHEPVVDSRVRKGDRLGVDYGRAIENLSDGRVGVELDETVYALDASTIDLCLSLFPWARFRRTKSAVKLHTLLNLRGDIPEFIHISDGKLHDVNVLDILVPEAGSVYVMDRGYLDFERLYALRQAMAFFVTRAKRRFQCKRRYSRPVDKATGLRCDQTIVLTGFYSAKKYPEPMRRIVYVDAETGKPYWVHRVGGPKWGRRPSEGLLFLLELFMGRPESTSRPSAG